MILEIDGKTIKRLVNDKTETAVVADEEVAAKWKELNKRDPRAARRKWRRATKGLPVTFDPLPEVKDGNYQVQYRVRKAKRDATTNTDR